MLTIKIIDGKPERDLTLDEIDFYKFKPKKITPTEIIYYDSQEDFDATLPTVAQTGVALEALKNATPEEIAEIKKLLLG